MALTRVYTSGPIVFGGTGAFNLDGVETQMDDVGAEVVRMFAAGQVDPSFAAIFTIAPKMTATITDIKTAIDGGIFLNGLAFETGGSAITTCDIYFVQTDASGTRKSGSNHSRTRFAKGLVVPRRIMARQGEPAKMDIEIWPVYDGTNEIAVPDNAVALPHTPVIDEAWTLGPVSFNGTAVDGLQEWTLDFGIEVEAMYSDGLEKPSRVHISQRAPTLDIPNKDLAQYATFTLDGTVQTATDSVFYLRKMVRASSTLANATAEHIKFTVDDGLFVPMSRGGPNNRSHDQRTVYSVLYDGTNAPIIANTASAIT